jgi:hypothetical protein
MFPGPPEHASVLVHPAPGAVLTVLARRAAARRFDLPIPRVSCSRLRRHHSFCETDKRDGCQVGNHCPIGDLWPIAFLGCSRGHRVPQRLVRKAQGPNFRFGTHSRTRASQEEPDWHHQALGDGTDSLSETSSCLPFSLFGVETHSFLPDDQSDCRHLACQG